MATVIRKSNKALTDKYIMASKKTENYVANQKLTLVFPRLQSQRPAEIFLTKLLSE